MGGKRLEEGQDVVGGMACPGCFPLEINMKVKQPSDKMKTPEILE